MSRRTRRSRTHGEAADLATRTCWSAWLLLSEKAPRSPDLATSPCSCDHDRRSRSRRLFADPRNHRPPRLADALPDRDSERSAWDTVASEEPVTAGSVHPGSRFAAPAAASEIDAARRDAIGIRCSQDGALAARAGLRHGAPSVTLARRPTYVSWHCLDRYRRRRPSWRRMACRGAPPRHRTAASPADGGDPAYELDTRGDQGAAAAGLVDARKPPCAVSQVPLRDAQVALAATAPRRRAAA